MDNVCSEMGETLASLDTFYVTPLGFINDEMYLLSCVPG